MPKPPPSYPQQREFLDRWLSEPQTYPDVFKSWLINFIQQNPSLLLDVNQLPGNIPWEKLKVDDGDIEGNKLNWHIGASPPGSPVDGMIWLYEGSGFDWQFVYDSGETTYKWKFIGGGSAWSQTLTSQAWSGTASTWQNLTGNPTFTVPRAGDYEVEFNCHLLEGNTAGIMIARAAVSINSTSTPSGVYNGGQTAASSGDANLAGCGVLAALSANDVLRMLIWQNSGATNNNYDARTLKVRPIRVS
jgi:hypothetical protein